MLAPPKPMFGFFFFKKYYWFQVNVHWKTITMRVKTMKNLQR